MNVLEENIEKWLPFLSKQEILTLFEQGIIKVNLLNKFKSYFLIYQDEFWFHAAQNCDLNIV